jgi:NCAIR mutase (PurE)-related protein
MDLNDILKSVKEGKTDLETAEQQVRGLGFCFLFEYS